MLKVKFNYENKLKNNSSSSLACLFPSNILILQEEPSVLTGSQIVLKWLSMKKNSKLVRIFCPKHDKKVSSHRQPLCNDLRTSQNWLLFLQDDIKQECIPVGWVPSAAVTVIGVCLQRRGVCIKVGCLLGGPGCLPGGCTAPLD